MRLAILAALAFAAPALAHDFWVQPNAFAVAPDAPVPFTLQVGHGKDRVRWGGAASRILRLGDIGPKGEADRRASLKLGGQTDDGAVSFAGAGVHILALATDQGAKNDLPSIRFNDYIKAEGLTSAIAQRTRLGQNDSNGREIYGRRAKALVLVGNPTGPQPQVTRAVGLTLEIVPQLNPYTLAPAAKLPVLVLYEGKPLPGATVKLNNLDFDARPIAVQSTDANGVTAFTIPRFGKWQLNVVWTKPITGNPDGDFDTVFSSLTFGFPPPR